MSGKGKGKGKSKKGGKGKGGKSKGGIELEADQFTAEEFMKREEMRRKALKDDMEEEARMTKINSLTIQNRWRTILRAAKVEELKRDIEVLAQSHDRQVDRKDAVIQMLASDLDDAEEQYNIALRSHLQNVDALIELQRSRVSALEKQFEMQLKELEQEFDLERTSIKAHHASEKEDIQSIIAALKYEAEAAEDALKQELSAVSQEENSKRQEELEYLKVELEEVTERYNTIIREEHQQYITTTDEKLKQYLLNKGRDKEMAAQIDAQVLRIHRMQETLASWKSKLASSVRESKERNELLQKEKDSMSKHYKDLKRQMTKFRDAQERSLTDLVSHARDASKELKEQLDQAERILKLGELNRRLETEREKVLPFLPNFPVSEQIEEEFSEETLAELEAIKQEMPQEEWGLLENFYKRYNKVLLDTTAIQAEKAQLEFENTKLRALLKQYLDGISVNQEVLATANPLMVVNHRSNLPVQATRQLIMVKPTVVEAAHVLQYQRS